MAKLSKQQFENLKKKLSLKKDTVWDKASPAQRKEIMAQGERYKDFLNQAKTERMAVETIRALARKHGFKEMGPKVKGKKIFVDYHGKYIALAVLGKRPPSQGLRIVGSHLDAPRLDLKTHPLYENQELAFLKTQYYGGIKKYQWLARPMALHGVICTKEGREVQIHLGDDPADPVFTILDLLPHLARKAQADKKMSEAIEGERMNLLIGGIPVDSEEKGDKVKLAVLQILNRQYGIDENDFISAELEIVPAGPARDVGLDRALVGGYGQDDRSSAFAELEAIFQVKNPEITSLALFVDKEETGSDGATGARSRFLEILVAGLMEAAGEKASLLKVARALSISKAVSADVAGAFDPDYPEVHEKLNAAYMGYGIVLHKYTGSGGKYGASDANAEFMAWMRRVWDEAGVVWHAGGLGKIDEGGGGTIAKFLAEHGMEIVDAGPSVLSMHSPFEISHKADIYSACQAYRAFFQAPAK